MTEIAGDFLRLDYGPILARVREEGAAFGQTMKAESTTEDEALLIKDCELIQSWVHASAGYPGKGPRLRQRIVRFVLNYREIIGEWPAWANGWISGGGE